MTDPILQMYLPAFMLIATILIVFWKQFRKFSVVTESLPNIEKITEYNRLKRIGGVFWIVFSAFIIMTIIYAVLPDFYFIFLPLDEFHHPMINSMGLLIMKLALVWILIAQIHIDKELYKYSRSLESLSAMELVRYSEKMLSTGMLVLFVGFFTTITNIIGLILVVSSLLIYFEIFIIKKPIYRF